MIFVKCTYVHNLAEKDFRQITLNLQIFVKVSPKFFTISVSLPCSHRRVCIESSCD